MITATEAEPLQHILRLKALGDLDRAAREAEDALRKDMRVDVLRELADIRAKKGQWRAAHEAIDRGLALIANAIGEDETRDALLERRAWIFFREGNFSDARRLYLRVQKGQYTVSDTMYGAPTHLPGGGFVQVMVNGEVLIINADRRRPSRRTGRRW